MVRHAGLLVTLLPLLTSQLSHRTVARRYLCRLASHESRFGQALCPGVFVSSGCAPPTHLLPLRVVRRLLLRRFRSLRLAPLARPYRPLAIRGLPWWLPLWGVYALGLIAKGLELPNSEVFGHHEVLHASCIIGHALGMAIDVMTT